MRTGELAAPQWIERLAGALAELAEIQEHDWDEIDWQRQERGPQASAGSMS